MSARIGDQPAQAGARAVSAIRAWVALYTRGLSEEQAADRRTLIEADLWDEANAAAWLGTMSSLERQRWSRLVRGIPSDLSWRLQRRRGSAKDPGRIQMRTSKVMVAVIGVAAALYTLMLGGLLAQADFWSFGGMVFVVVGLGMAIIGLVLSIRRPREGFIVGMSGTGLAFVLTWWLFPFYIPLPIILGYRLIKWQDAQQVSAPGA
jgi:hypothetical protein